MMTLKSNAINSCNYSPRLRERGISYVMRSANSIILVHGSPSTQNHGSVERTNGNIEDMANALLHDNRAFDLSAGLHICSIKEELTLLIWKWLRTGIFFLLGFLKIPSFFLFVKTRRKYSPD